MVEAPNVMLYRPRPTSRLVNFNTSAITGQDSGATIKNEELSLVESYETESRSVYFYS